MEDYDKRRENLYKSKVLIGNWFEDRSDHSNQGHQHFRERKQDKVNYSTLTTEEFNKTNPNWLSFQNVTPQATFKTVYNIEFQQPAQQTRTAEVNPFLRRKGPMETTPGALEEYRNKWTKQPLCADREYLGAQDRRDVNTPFRWVPKGLPTKTQTK